LGRVYLEAKFHLLNNSASGYKRVRAFSIPTIHCLEGTDLKTRNVTRKELGESIKDKLGISYQGASEIVDAVFATMKQSLVAGESVKLIHFGTLVVQDKSPRRGRNPKTGESLTIAKRQMITFRLSRELRARLNT